MAIKKLLRASKLRRGLSLGKVGFKELSNVKWTWGHIFFAAVHGITFQMYIRAARGRSRTDATAITALIAGVSAHLVFVWMTSERAGLKTSRSPTTHEKDDTKVTCKDDEACADIIMVSSATSFQAPKMGSYVRTSISPGIRNAGRPVLKNRHGQYLSFDSSGGCWRIGPDHNTGLCGLRSKRLENAWCPSRATGWEIFHHKDWHVDPSIGVVQVSISVGDDVEVRNADQCPDWKSARVTSVRPLLSKVDGSSESTLWDEVRQKVPENAPSPVPCEAEGQVKQINVKVTKGPKDKVGLDVEWQCLDRLRVKKINEGLIAKWNLAKPSKCVEVGDEIVEVNGVHGNSAALLQAVQSSSTLDFLIVKQLQNAGRGSHQAEKSCETSAIDAEVKPPQDEGQCLGQADRSSEMPAVAADAASKMQAEDYCKALQQEVQSQKTRSDALAMQLSEAKMRMEAECRRLRAEGISHRDRAKALEKELAMTRNKLELAFVKTL